LCINVKWPASTFYAQAGKKPAASADQVSDSQIVPENGPESMLWGEAAADPGPELGSKPKPDWKSEPGS
jgi:hypothetical protein